MEIVYFFFDLELFDPFQVEVFDHTDACVRFVALLFNNKKSSYSGFHIHEVDVLPDDGEQRGREEFSAESVKSSNYVFYP